MLVALGLGSNLGERESNLRFAIHALRRYLRNPRVSSPFLTQPLPVQAQREFLNAVVVGFCELEAEALLGVAKALEWVAGRRRAPRLAPRPLDIDLLVVGDRVTCMPELTLPHPRLRQRRFALAPLAEIAPRLTIPPDHATVSELLAALPGDQSVTRGGWSAPLL